MGDKRQEDINSPSLLTPWAAMSAAVPWNPLSLCGLLWSGELYSNLGSHCFIFPSFILPLSVCLSFPPSLSPSPFPSFSFSFTLVVLGLLFPYKVLAPLVLAQILLYRAPGLWHLVKGVAKEGRREHSIKYGFCYFRRDMGIFKAIFIGFGWKADFCLCIKSEITLSNHFLKRTIFPKNGFPLYKSNTCSSKIFEHANWAKRKTSKLPEIPHHFGLCPFSPFSNHKPRIHTFFC